ncbi:putative F-box/kelch-repeat protein At1g13200 [Magnolia sinica]|uniref:putative F-box/kelch-repeat protein At1g13200 n=1 Tax=Magnolia sinica TaxID=86752 RepID=UPI002659A1D2|nr:putative F-box/kelch-repeat protein At1g13200 [Magnolia sinica]XP_058090294.1 putative F-box/kelch-repeat protein At1g13200 [Magnolia sinica]XP_058090296.1 putative F-box/kelch-repeat protein At1g13200 [Magnolia sinica]XP_058090297.1 putative F-box/kelch-repeat protein At1g13200 [Magnolia sinica]XP_058090298.1 putative F-box/kelch-repeat protein At1g13200 [Magnolia sinica]XP_058090299.1 putative F-box/kelch-repeat protein At1g13200 [Magnolia sinica]
MARKKKGSVSFMSLPQDIIIEILVRLPVKSLIRFKCVSKAWYDLIIDPSFVDAHLHHSKSIPGFIVETPIPLEKFDEIVTDIDFDPSFVDTQFDRSEYGPESVTESPVLNKINFDPFFFEVKATPKNNKSYFVDMGRSIGDLTLISASCDGLILLESMSTYGLFYICNPATHEWMCLGRHIDPPQGFHIWGLAFDPTISKYKAIRTCADWGRQEICEIITIEENFNSWREVRVPQPHHPRFFPPVFANSSLYWMIHHRDIPDMKGSLAYDLQSKGHILAMDVSEETFHLIPHPECKSGSYTLLEMGGLLCFANQVSHTQLDLWVLKDMKKLVWTKEHSINMMSFTGSTVPFKSFLDDVLPFAVLENPRRIVFKWPNRRRRLCFYNVEKRTLSKVNLECKFIPPGRVAPYVHVNSLVSWF